MNADAKQREIHYPILLFICVLGLALTRGVVNGLFETAGRNGVWMIFPCGVLVLFGTWIGTRAVRGARASSMLTAGPHWFAPVNCLLYGLLFTGCSLYLLLLNGDFFSRTMLYGDQRMLMVLGPLSAAVTAMFDIAAIARNAHLMMLFIVPLFLIVSLLTIRDAHWTFLSPVLDAAGLRRPMDGIAAIMIMFIPLGAATMLVSRMKDRGAFRSLSVLVLAVAIFASYIYAAGIAVHGLNSVGRQAFAVHFTYGAIRVENFVFERIMFMALLMWAYFYILTTAFMTRFAVFCFAQIFAVRLRAWHMFIFAAVAIVILRLPMRPVYFLPLSYALGFYSLFMLVVFPLLMYGWTKIARSGSGPA